MTFSPSRRIPRFAASGPLLAPLPRGTGATVDGRPVLNFSFALNYAVGGTEVFGYHLANLGIHILAGLYLFGILRRTLERTGGGGPEGDASCVAAVCALVSDLPACSPPRRVGVLCRAAGRIVDGPAVPNLPICCDSFLGRGRVLRRGTVLSLGAACLCAETRRLPRRSRFWCSCRIGHSWPVRFQARSARAAGFTWASHAAGGSSDSWLCAPETAGAP